MNVAEAFQSLCDENAQHGIETGVSLYVAIPDYRMRYDHNAGLEFPAVGAAEIAIAHVLAQHCEPAWLQETTPMPIAEHDHYGKPQYESGVANRLILQAMLSAAGDSEALHNLTLQAAALDVPSKTNVTPNIAPIDLRLDAQDQPYGMTTTALAEATARTFGVSETSVVRRVATRAMTAEFPRFGVRNAFTSRKLHTVNEAINISNLVVTNKLGILNTEDAFVRSDIGYIADKGLVVSYAIFERGSTTGDEGEVAPAMAENSIQLMGSIIYSFIQAKLLES